MGFKGFLKANTAVTLKLGPFLDSADGNTNETGLTISQADVRLSKNGGNYAQKNESSSCTHDELGKYDCPVDATDTNTEGRLDVTVHESGALIVDDYYMVFAEAAYDSLFTAKDTGFMDINIKAISEDETAANNLELACDNYSATRGLAGTALPAAAADAAGGLPVSDTGGLDLDTQLANTNEVTAARMGALTDWIDGGRLDLILDTIAADVVNIDGDAMRGTDSAATAAKLIAYVQLMLRSDAAIETDRATELGEINNDEGSGAGDFSSQAEAQEAIRDRGDAAWTTGGGGSLTQIINAELCIPTSIDLANTATIRLGLRVVNSVDDLPSTAEITPGTVSIDRKAIGGTSWSAVVTDAACSEAAGYIYYDEVFDSGTGYAEGDSLRITFKSQSVTADANTHEITGSGGVICYTEIRQSMRGTDSAALASVCTEGRLGELDAGNIPGDVDSITGKLPSKSYLAGTANSDGDIQMNEATGNFPGSVASVVADVGIADGEISSAKFDNSTAFPIASTDSGNTQIARTGADGDTLETLSDQLDGVGVIQDNTLGKIAVSSVLTIPTAGTNTYRIEFALYDMAGNMEAPDAAPTIGVVNQGGTSRNANLSATTMVEISTGRYRVTYDVANTHAKEALNITVSCTEEGAARNYTVTVKATDDLETKVDAMYDAFITSHSELAGAPAHNASTLDKIEFLFMALKNEAVADNSGAPATTSVGNNAGTAIATADITETADTSTKGQYS